mgnify:CR=1 FL=1
MAKLHKVLAMLGALVTGLFHAAGAWAYTETSGGWNLPTGATDIGAEVFSLHMWMFWICTVIGSPTETRAAATLPPARRPVACRRRA